MTLVLLVEAGGHTLAVPAAAVAEVVLVPSLWRPPAMPPVLEGVMNLRGRAVPVVRLDRLLGVPAAVTGLFAVVVVLARPEPAGVEWAVLVDRAVDVVDADPLPPPPDVAFNDCVGAVLAGADGTVAVLEPGRLLRRRERLALAAFRDRAEQRLEEWGLVRD